MRMKKWKIPPAPRYFYDFAIFLTMGDGLWIIFHRFFSQNERVTAYTFLEDH